MSADCKVSPDDDEAGEKNRQWQAKLQQCSEPDKTPQITEEELKGSLGEILRILQLKQCTSTTGAGVLPIPPALGGGTTNSGCEQIQIIASKLLMNTRINQCMLNAISSSRKVNTDVENRVELEIFEESVVACQNGFNITQEIDIDVVDKTLFTATMTAVMSTELQQKITESFEQIQKQQTGFMATVNGQKLLSEAVSAINTSLVLEQMNCAVTKILEDLTASNITKVRVGPRGYLTAAECNISQKIQLKKTSESLVASAIDTVMDLKAVTEYFKSMSQFQDNVAKGPELGSFMLILILAGLGLLFALVFATVKIMNSNGVKYFFIFLTVMGVIGLLTGAGIAIYKLVNDAEKTKLKEQLDAKFPPCTSATCAEPGDATDPTVECPNISLPWPNPTEETKEEEGVAVFYFTYGTTPSAPVKAIVDLREFWTEGVDYDTFCLRDFVEYWNGDGVRTGPIGQLTLLPNGQLNLEPIALVAPVGQPLQVTGQLVWWFNLGFEQIQKTGSVIRGIRRPIVTAPPDAELYETTPFNVS
jgi:phosphoribosylformylglycinamidine (FGAM) synthase PurS component